MIPPSAQDPLPLEPWIRVAIRARRAAARILRAAGLRGPSPAEVEAVFGAGVPGGPSRVASDIHATRVTRFTIDAIARQRGAAWLERSVRLVGLDALRAGGRGVALVGWHAGVLRPVSHALARAGVPALVIAATPPPIAPPGIDFEATGQGGRAAATLKRAVDRARAGGVVFHVADVPWSDDDQGLGAVPLLGRRVRLRSCAALLARVGGAAIVPVTSRWNGRALEVEAHAPVVARAPEGAGPEARDAAVTAALCAFWEGYLRAHPGELWPESLRAIARSPRL